MSKRTVPVIKDVVERHEFQVLNYYKNGEEIRSDEDMCILKRYGLIGYVHFGLGDNPEASLTKKGLWYVLRFGRDAIDD